MSLCRTVAQPDEAGVIGRSVSYEPTVPDLANAKAIVDDETLLVRAHLPNEVPNHVLCLGARYMATFVNLNPRREGRIPVDEGTSSLACGRRAERRHDR
jgi:hypothetical protein